MVRCIAIWLAASTRSRRAPHRVAVKRCVSSGAQRCDGRFGTLPALTWFANPLSKHSRSLSMMHRKPDWSWRMALAARRCSRARLPRRPRRAAEPADAPLTGNVALTTQLQVPWPGPGHHRQQRARPGSSPRSRAASTTPSARAASTSATGTPASTGCRATASRCDLYGGYKFEGGRIDWDVGVLQYFYPGNTAGNTTELYGAGTWADETSAVHRQVLAHRLQGLLRLRRRPARGSGLERPATPAT